MTAPDIADELKGFVGTDIEYEYVRMRAAQPVEPEVLPLVLTAGGKVGDHGDVYHLNKTYGYS